MPRESEYYRDNLERITERYPGKEILRPKEVATLLGVDVKTAKKLFSFNAGYISVARLARQMP